MPKTFADSFGRFVNTLHLKLDAPTKVHLRRVYGSLSLSMMAAAGGAYVHVATDYFKGSVWTLLLSIGALMLINTTAHRPDNEWQRLGYLMAFAGLSGISVGPLLDYVLLVKPKIIVTAFCATCAVFTSFTLAALYAPDRRMLYLIGTLLAMLSTMCWITLFNIFLGMNFLFQVNLYLGLAVMCGFILYDTQLIIEKYVNRGDDDYIRHSMDLFIDFIGLFRRVLILLLQKEQRKKKD